MSTDRPKRPRLRPDVTVIPHSADELEIRIGVWNTVTSSLTDEERTGALYSIVARLDGNQSAQEIATATGAGRSVVEGVIEHLLDLNALQDGTVTPLDIYLQNISSIATSSPPDKPKLVEIIGSPRLTSALLEAISEAGVAERMVELRDDDHFAAKLRRIGIASMSGGNLPPDYEEMCERADNSLLILITPSPDLALAHGISFITAHRQQPWLHATLDGPVAFVGPSFDGKGGPCYACFEKRIEMNIREKESYLKYKRALLNGKVSATSPEHLSALDNLLVAHTALEAINLLAVGNTFTRDKALCIYLPTMEFAYNRVLALTGCPICDPEVEIKREKYFDLSAVLNGKG